MIKFNRPTNLNGTELREELNNAGVTISNEMNAVNIDGNGDLWLDIKASDQVKAESIVANHNGTIIPPQPTVAEKLASVGLSIDDLKGALGL